jgi:hypothetical protein
MGINPADLNDKQRALIDASDRKKLGKAGRTWAEAQAIIEHRLERKLQDDFIGFCKRHRIAWTRSNPSKRSQIGPGAPDFHLSKNDRSCYAEFKVGKNKLSPEQVKYIEWLEECGNTVFVWYSYAQATNDCAKFFKLTTQIGAL